MAIRSWVSWWWRNTHCSGWALVMWLCTPVVGDKALKAEKADIRITLRHAFITQQLAYTNNKRYFHCDSPPPPSPLPFFHPISISYQNWCLKGTGVYGMAIWSGPMLSTALIQLQALGTRAKRGFRLSHLLPNTLQVTTRVSTSATHVLKWL